ncbi:MAG: CotH kinase family protein [Bacteroidales bacterium]|nr:MAG: CotH kinase family protein [Bacteroidales bacterium]
MRGLLLSSVILLIIGSAGIAQTEQIDHYETVIHASDLWRFSIGDTEPDTNWRDLSFNDSLWTEQTGAIGYGDGDDSQPEIEPCISLYLRKKFTIIDTANIKTVIFHIDYDDAFVAYINDIEIARANISGEHPAHDQEADSQHEASMYQGGLPDDFIIDKGCLKPGDNIMAVQVHNRSATSSDMSSATYLTLGISDTSHAYRDTPDWFEPPKVFTSSNLPIVIITTENGVDIPDEPKITANMKIIHNGPSARNYLTDQANIYNGYIGIEIRGSYSARLPQKPYGVETRDSEGNNLNVSLLSLPEENDWILLANYNDKVFMRNTLAFHLFRKMGHYSSGANFCEVFVNNEYQGIYVLIERIKRDRNRVAIARLDSDDNAGDSLTGGYIFKTDYFDETDSWKSSYPPFDRPEAEVYFVYHDPEPDEITIQQKDYIQNFVYTFETVLHGNNFKDPAEGYRTFIDVNSFIDYFIIGEISRDVDAYKKSRYLYKDRDDRGGLLTSGPVWDYDWAWKNIAECLVDQTDGSGWAYRINDCNPRPAPPAWMVRLLEDDYYADRLHTRYFTLRETLLSENYIFNYIDSIHSLLDEAQERHYDKWPILGINVGAPEVDYQPDTYQGEVDKFKAWISLRLSWLDNNMPGEFIHTDIDKPVQNITYRLFPNPVKDILYCEASKQIRQIEVYNSTGSLVKNIIVNNKYSVKIPVQDLNPGIYVARAKTNTKEVITGRFIIE